MTTSSNPNRVSSAADLVNGSSSQLVVAKLQDLWTNLRCHAVNRWGGLTS